LVLGLAACGGEEEKRPASSAPKPTATTGEPKGSLTNLAAKPRIPKPGGAPPKRLGVKDVVPGKGKAAKAGDSVTVQYVGVTHRTGKQFDASWDRGEPFTFDLGTGMVIPGWDEGLEGMKEGGRRLLSIPPEQAYGSEGSPPDIGPNEALVFVIDLKRVR